MKSGINRKGKLFIDVGNRETHFIKQGRLSPFHRKYYFSQFTRQYNSHRSNGTWMKYRFLTKLFFCMVMTEIWSHILPEWLLMGIFVKLYYVKSLWLPGCFFNHHMLVPCLPTTTKFICLQEILDFFHMWFNRKDIPFS